MDHAQAAAACHVRGSKLLLTGTFGMTTFFCKYRLTNVCRHAAQRTKTRFFVNAGLRILGATCAELCCAVDRALCCAGPENTC